MFFVSKAHLPVLYYINGRLALPFLSVRVVCVCIPPYYCVYERSIIKIIFKEGKYYECKMAFFYKFCLLKQYNY